MIEKMKMRASVVLRDWHRAAGSDDDDVKVLVIFRPTMMHDARKAALQVAVADYIYDNHRRSTTMRERERLQSKPGTMVYVCGQRIICDNCTLKAATRVMTR